MNKVEKKKTDAYRKVMYWYISFVPLGIASVLFVFCFLFEKSLLLYVLCTAIFAVFVVLFIRADKQIACKDGYTLIQALLFYRECRRAGTEDISAENEIRKICAIAQRHDYARELNTKQCTQLYKIGKTLYEQMDKKWR